MVSICHSVAFCVCKRYLLPNREQSAITVNGTFQLLGDRLPWRVVGSCAVARREKTLEQVLSGTSDANVGFEDLRNLLISLGFRERTRGSHHIFRRAGIEEMINLQREGANAKQYQVRQVRAVILKYRLEE